MTKKRIDEIRAMRDAARAAAYPWEDKAWCDISDLLDEAERLTAEVERIKKVAKEQIDLDGKAKRELAAERDKWQKRAERLECAAYGMCAVCLHFGEPVNRDVSPCFEMGLTSGSGYSPQCAHFEIDEAKFAGEEKK